MTKQAIVLSILLSKTSDKKKYIRVKPLNTFVDRDIEDNVEEFNEKLAISIKKQLKRI